VLRIVGDEVRGQGARARRTIDEIAARAGTCRTVVKNAIRVAAAMGLLTIQERRREGPEEPSQRRQGRQSRVAAMARTGPEVRPTDRPKRDRGRNAIPRIQKIKRAFEKCEGDRRANLCAPCKPFGEAGIPAKLTHHRLIKIGHGAGAGETHAQCR
jgi:hypothetical protein